MKLSEILKITRQKSFMTQEDLASRLSVTPSTINRWEHGKAKPNMTAMKRLRTFCEEESISFEEIETAWLIEKNSDE